MEVVNRLSRFHLRQIISHNGFWTCKTISSHTTGKQYEIQILSLRKDLNQKDRNPVILRDHHQLDPKLALREANLVNQKDQKAQVQ